MLTAPRARRGVQRWLNVGLVSAAALASACVEPVPPPWRLDRPRLLLVEMEVIATGPYATPLALDPPAHTRCEVMPGDRLALRPIFAGPSGPIELEAPPIWLRSPNGLLAYSLGGPLPPCDDDGNDGARLCRLAGAELGVPWIGVDWAAVLVAGVPGGPSAETCLARLNDGAKESLSECFIAEVPLQYGPPHLLAQLGVGDPETPESAPNYNLRGLALSLEITGSAGRRTIVAAHGETVTVEADDQITAEPIIDEAELQEYVYADTKLTTESLRAEWWTSAELFTEWNDAVTSPSVSFAIPPFEDGFDLHLNVGDRGGVLVNGIEPPRGGRRWLWVRVHVRGRGSASP